MTTTCNHPIGSVACVLDEGHEGGHQGIEESSEQWRIDTLANNMPNLLPNDSVPVRFGDRYGWIALPREIAQQVVADHNRASSLDATLTRAQTAEAALAEAKAALEYIRHWGDSGMKHYAQDALSRIDQHPTQEAEVDHE